jgi:hypothetical protein
LATFNHTLNQEVVSMLIGSQLRSSPANAKRMQQSEHVRGHPPDFVGRCREWEDDSQKAFMVAPW